MMALSLTTGVTARSEDLLYIYPWQEHTSRQSDDQSAGSQMNDRSISARADSAISRQILLVVRLKETEFQPSLCTVPTF